MENSFAVITGASSGIGYELAKQFGERGFDLLIASHSDSIFEAQRDLEDLGYNVEAVKVNLGTYSGVENFYQQILRTGKVLDAIAINAGIGVGGPFEETSINQEIKLINLNVISAIHLTKRIIPEMKIRGKGRILYTSSVAAEMPSPFQAVYGASKAFLTSFAEAIRNELRDTGVSITILNPGATNTNFFKRANMEETKVGSELKYNNDPAEVARQGVDALLDGKESVTAGSFMTKLQGYALKILPRRTKANLHRQTTEPGSALH